LTVLAGPFQAVGCGADKFVFLERCLGLLIHWVFVFLCARPRRGFLRSARSKRATLRVYQPGRKYIFRIWHRASLSRRLATSGTDPSPVLDCTGKAPTPPHQNLHNLESREDAAWYIHFLYRLIPPLAHDLEGPAGCRAPHCPLVLLY
jgi:hypothetical protein